jgi:hypothetical protein
VVAVMALLGFAAAGVALAPRGIDAGYLLLHQDDPVALADRVVKTSLDPAVAQREIEAALAADDIDLANSFLDLAREENIAVDQDLVARVAAANSAKAVAVRTTKSFAEGLITGEPRDAVGFAGTALGDLFVFGDIRDALREGSRLAAGEKADELILGLAGVGLAVTAGTYASLGVGGPARVGISLLKGARKAGRLGEKLSVSLGRALRRAAELSGLSRMASNASLLHPVAAVRAARDAVKLDRAGGVLRLFEDTERVQAKAGTRAAMDGLKVAEQPQDMARLARLAEKKGSKTRAILKLGGRAALAVTMALFTLANWSFSALMMLIGFLAAVKNLTERLTWRWIRWGKARKARRLKREQQARERLALAMPAVCSA